MRGVVENPVNVTSEIELATIAAGVVAVASSHGEVGKGGDEADKAFNHSRTGQEGAQTEVHVLMVAPEVVAKGAVDEGPGRKEENDEANPQADAPGASHVQGASVDGAMRLVHSDCWSSHGSAVRLLGSVGLLAVVGELAVLLLLSVGRNGVGGRSVLDAGNAAALGLGEEGCVAGAVVHAALGGRDVGWGGSSFVRRSRVGHRWCAVGLLGGGPVALVAVGTLRISTP